MKKLLRYLVIIMVIFSSSCESLTDVNINPYALTPENADINYVMRGAMSSFTAKYHNWSTLGIPDGVMQYTQLHGGGYDPSYYNLYEYVADLKGSNINFIAWDEWYAVIKNADLVIQLAEEQGSDFHKGVCTLIKAWSYGIIADNYGDAPLTEAVNDNYSSPKFDTQESIYDNVFLGFEAAFNLFVSSIAKEELIADKSADLFYKGNRENWKKLTASLIVRYAMRLSEKKPDIAKKNIEAYYDEVFGSSADNCAVPAVSGTYNWKQYSSQSIATFNYYKLHASLVTKLHELKDPRIVVWGQPVAVPSVAMDLGANDTISKVITDAGIVLDYNGTPVAGVTGTPYIRIINSNAANQTAKKYKQFDFNTYSTDRPRANPGSQYSLYDTSRYVGIPTGYFTGTQKYNLNEAATNDNINNYVSTLRKDIFSLASGSFLEYRLCNYTEICFTLAEAAVRGWNVGNSVEFWYNEGISSSFGYWKIATTYNAEIVNYPYCVPDLSTYTAQAAVNLSGLTNNQKIERIIEQKWLGAFLATLEPWKDYCRLGLPMMEAGPYTIKEVLPIRFQYTLSTMGYDAVRAAEVESRFESTPYDNGQKNSAWSKPWLFQGVEDDLGNPLPW